MADTKLYDSKYLKFHCSDQKTPNLRNARKRLNKVLLFITYKVFYLKPQVEVRRERRFTFDDNVIFKMSLPSVVFFLELHDSIVRQITNSIHEYPFPTNLPR